MKRYTTPEEIRNAFIKNGWTEPHFVEATAEDLKIFTPKPTGKIFIMTSTGNMYTDTGKLFFYNIPAGDCHRTTLPA